jgi:SLT domain-containing protein
MQTENNIGKEQAEQFLNDISNSFTRFSSEIPRKATSLNRNEYSLFARGSVDDGVRRFLDRLSSAFEQIEGTTNSHPEEKDSVGVTTYMYDDVINDDAIDVKNIIDKIHLTSKEKTKILMIAMMLF